jgi:uncharacterized membrane protein
MKPSRSWANALPAQHLYKCWAAGLRKFGVKPNLRNVLPLSRQSRQCDEDVN